MGTSAETQRKEMEISSNEKIANQNLEFQKQKLAYDQQLQQQIFNREDTAYQRTVADMRAAGISPLALQGTNAAGEAIQTTAPQNGMVYDYTSGMSTDSDKINAAISAFGQISSVMQQSQQIRALKLQNDFTEKTLNQRVAREQAQTILAKYSALDARDKRYFQNVFGVNEHMPREMQLANITAVLSMSDDEFKSRLDGKSLREFEGSNYDFTKMLNYGTYDKRTFLSLLNNVSDALGYEKVLEEIVNSDKKGLSGLVSESFFGKSLSEMDKEIIEKGERGEKLNPFESFVYWLHKKGVK